MAHAQVPNRGAAQAMLEEVIVTATKQSRGELSQDVPITMSAFGEGQIEALKIRDLMDLGKSMPNVSFEQVSSKGTANFTIRGLGINSSKISTAPAVGIFVNGAYIGQNQGVLFDAFDLDGIEVLRGPQGTLFGRNVTGGAVLLRYKRPEAEPDFHVRARYETGPYYSVAAAGGGALAENVFGRVTMFYDRDEGYFEAPLLGKSHYPQNKSYSIRPSLRFAPSDRTDITLFTEVGRVWGEGPPNIAPDYEGGTLTAPGTQPRHGLKYNDLLVTIAGSTEMKWSGATLEARHDVDFGTDASITSVTNYREVFNFSYGDLDGTPVTIAAQRGLVDQHQFSEELRYNGTFGAAKVTTGLYYFKQDAIQMGKAVTNTISGGRLMEDVYGVFGQVDYELTDALTLQVGGRYTKEKKKARIAPQASETPGVIVGGANGVPGSCWQGDAGDPYGCNWVHRQSANYEDFSPKVTVQYRVAPDLQVYATAQKAFRSGGFNSQYNAAFPQNPFDPEKQRAFEAGFKSNFFDNKTRLNGAVFLTKIEDLQRDLTILDPVFLVTTQQSLNTADATIKGYELELTQELTPNIVLTANVGRTISRYDKIRYDITADPASAGGPQVNDFDYRQRLPRAMPWTYGLGLTADHMFSFGALTFRTNWTHTEDTYFPDYNNHRRDGANPVLPGADIIDAQLTFEPVDSKLSITLYGKNLTNEYTLGNFTPQVYPNVKASAAYPNKGRIVGLEIGARF